MCTEELDRIVEYRGRRRRKKVGDKNNNNNNNDKMKYFYRN